MLAGVEGVEDVLCRFFGHSFEVGEGFKCEVVEVANVTDEIAVDQLLDKSGTKTFNVHCGARGKVANVAFELSGASGVNAANGDFRFVSNKGGVTDRTGGGEIENNRILGTFGCDDTNNLGNDVAAFFENDGVAFANVFAFHFFGIV